MRFLERTSGEAGPVVVFGASVIGKIVLDALNRLKIRPACFCDNDPLKQATPFHGFRVISFETLLRDYPKARVVIAAGRYYQDIHGQLKNAGFQNIYSDADVISSIDFANTPRSELQEIMWHMAKLGKLAEIMEVPEGSLHIPRLNVVLTSRCTLRCKHCSSLIPHYQKPSDFDPATIIASLDRILSCADLIYHVELLGGEPFLSGNLPLVVNHLLDSGKVLHMDVITNGTIVPRDRVLEPLNHHSVSVVIDDYGEHSRKSDVLSQALSRLGIDFHINRHWAWADLGGLESRNRPQKKLATLFRNCHFNSCTELLDGKLHRCPRSSHGTKTGVLPEYADDYLSISESSQSDARLKESLRDFLVHKEYIRACDHCNGNTRSSLRLLPAEQH